jgi:transformation/transcription domain-associated protein
MRPHAPQLMQAILDVMNDDNEENGLLCLRISFDMHKAFRPTLEEQVSPFMEFVRKVIVSQSRCSVHFCCTDVDLGDY